MRFLADESCDAAVVRTLRHAGHDVVAVAERRPGADDRMVIGLARRTDRILLTEDKDFGQRVLPRKGTRQGFCCCGIPHALVISSRETSRHSSRGALTVCMDVSWSCSRDAFAFA